MTLIPASIDSWVNQSAPARNYGGGVRLQLNGGAGGNDRRAFLHFKPPPLGVTILSAKLRLFARGAWTGSQTVTARRVTGTWAEGRVTWNNQPAVVATNLASVAANALADAALIELDVTAMLQDVVNGAAFYGVRLELSADVIRQLHSSEATNANLRPVLEVEWIAAPDPPASLSPSGGRAVSVTKPVLSWVYTDPGSGAGSEQASSQVQISSSEDFGSPLYDSGKVANTLPSWDLAATAFGGLGLGDVRYWRVRVWDETDIVSEWSEAEEFTRTAKASLSIDSPAGATVDDLTPPIDWTFGATQEAFRLLVEEVPAAGFARRQDPLFDTGRVTDTDTLFELPVGLLRTGITVRVIVRVWDEVDRETTPGDPDYVEASHEFSYARSGAPDPVTALSATPQPRSPAVLLEFERTNLPDYFSLRVDGVEVAPRIEPADVQTSPGEFALTWWAATPRVSHLYEVEAVVDSAGSLEHSDGNATDSATTDPDGIWLVDEDDGVSVRLGGQDRADFAIDETGTTFRVKGSRVPVRITEDVRGYTGSIGGLLLGKADRDAFLELKGRLKPLRLVLSDLTFPIVLEDVAPSPTPLPRDRLFSATFAFFQVGEFTFDVVGD